MAKLYAPPSQNFLQKTLGAELLDGITASATLNNVTGIQNLPGVFIVDRVDTNNVETPSKREVIAFDSVSGSTLVTLTRGLAGTTDQDHAVGAIVEFAPDVIWAQNMYDALANVVSPSDISAINTASIVTPTGTQTLTNKIINGGTFASQTILNSNIINPKVYGGTFASLPVFSDQPKFMAGAYSPFVQISSATEMWVNFALGNKFKADITPGGARNFLATNATVGSMALLRMKFNSAASFALNIFATNATLSWVSNTIPTWNMSLSRVDTVGLVCNATLPKFDGFIVGQGILD